MKNHNLIASVGTLLVASAAQASFSVTQDLAVWATKMGPGGANLNVNYVDPGSIANFAGSGSSWTGGFGWEYFALNTTGVSGAVTTTTSGAFVTAVNFAGSTTFNYTSFQFDFVGSEAAWGPSGTDGIYGVYFNIQFTPGPDTAGVSVTINGTQTIVISGASTGIVGVYANSVASGRIDTVGITLSSGQSAVLTGYTVGIIPAPGAVALVAAAGLVGSRRRR